MDEPAADTLATVGAGRTAAVAQLRALATTLETLPLDAVAEVLVAARAGAGRSRRQAAFALERAPAGAG
jgi:hypothetical protein